MICNSNGNPDSKEDTIVLEDEEKTIEDSSEQKEGKESDETKTEPSEESEYVLAVSNLLTRIGDHLVLVEEVMDDYDYGDITLEELKLYIGDFIMMFNESYYPEYLELEPPIGYEDYYEYLGRAMEHIGKSSEYLQSFVDTNDEDEMLDNLDKALLELEQGSEWIEKATKEISE